MVHSVTAALTRPRCASRPAASASEASASRSGRPMTPQSAAQSASARTVTATQSSSPALGNRPHGASCSGLSSRGVPAAGEVLCRDRRAEVAEHHLGLGDADRAAPCRALAPDQQGECAHRADPGADMVRVHGDRIAEAARLTGVHPLVRAARGGAHQRAVAKAAETRARSARTRSCRRPRCRD